MSQMLKDLNLQLLLQKGMTILLYLVTASVCTLDSLRDSLKHFQSEM